MRLLTVCLIAGCADVELAELDGEIINGSISGSSPTTNAIVGVPNSTYPDFACTGILVSPNTVLSAGHCLTGSWAGPQDWQIDDGNWWAFRNGFHATIKFGPDPDNPIHTVRAPYRSVPLRLDQVNGTGHDDIVLLGFDEPVPPEIAIPRGIAYEDPGITATTNMYLYGYAGTGPRKLNLVRGFGTSGDNHWAATLQNGAIGEHGDSGGPLLYGSTGGPVAGVLQGGDLYEPPDNPGGPSIHGVETFGHGSSQKPDVSAWLTAAHGEQVFTRRAWVRSTAASGTGNLAGTGHNSRGGATTITHLGTGQYKVQFDAVATNANGGHVQVSAYGSTSERCKALLFGRSADDEYIYVLCHDAVTGALKNARFVASYTDRRNLSSAAYAYADNASVSHRPLSQYQWNPAADPDDTTSIYVERHAVGAYRVYIPYVTDTGPSGNVQVTQYGMSDASYCKGRSTSTAFSTVAIEVRCFDNAGVAVDRRFLVAYESTKESQKTGTYGVPAGARGNQPTASGIYWPSPQFNIHQHLGGGEGFNYVQRTSTGRYTVTMKSIPTAGAVPHVTGYGLDASYCKPVSYGVTTIDGGPGVNVFVACFAPGGALVNAQFDAVFLQADYEPAL